MNIEDKLVKSLSRREVLKYGLFGGLTAGLSGNLWLSGCIKKWHKGNPNIILITLDTTRMDRLGCYGYRRITSPNLDELASESVLYTRAIAPSSWTLPSHASLFTGKFTSSHGARYDPEGPLHLTDAITAPKSWQACRARGLARTERTLAEILKDAGYTTGGVVGGPWMKKIFGLSKGFDHYDDAQISSVNGRLAKQITAGAVKWLQRVRDKRFFLFLNYFDPHWPLRPPEGFASTFLPKGTTIGARRGSIEEMNALYDAEILYMDHYIGQLVKRLKADDLYDNSWIIVTSDHGELIGEHGKFGHGLYLYQEEIHVPLFMKYPTGEAAAKRMDSTIQLIDILPMICERLRISAPQDIQGAAPSYVNHPIVAETYPLPVLSEDGDWRAILDGSYKFLWNSRGRNQLFNLEDDPSEKLNVIGQEHERAEKMMAKLDQYLAGLQKPGSSEIKQELDEQTKEALKSLGYVK